MSAGDRPVSPAVVSSSEDEWPVQGAVVSSSQVLRLLLAVVSVAAMGIGVVALALGADTVRVVSLAVFCSLGVGAAPWQLYPRLGGYERLVCAFATAAAVLTLVPLLMLTIHAWHPAVAFALVTAAALPLHVLGVVRVGQELYAAGARRWPSTLSPSLILRRNGRWLPARRDGAEVMAVVGAVICLISALSHRHINPGAYGFLPQIGVWWYAGLVLVLVGAVVGGARERSRAVPVLLLVLVLTLTPALTYDGPRSQSAAKHVEFILEIRSLHELSTSVPIYNAYAGFFAAGAWFCDITGIADPMRLATLWPALLGVFRVLVLRYFAGQVLPTAQQSWVAVTLAVLVDSVSADYFSPQSIGFVLGFAAIGLALTKDPNLPRLTALLLAGGTLAVSHQLSPYIVAGVLVVLVAFRQIRPWWVPGLVLAPALAWSLLHWDAVRGFVSLGSFGAANNFRPPKSVVAPGLERLPVVSATVFALVAGVVCVGILGAVTLLRNRGQARYWAFACSAGFGLLVVAVNPYGQEGIFRAVLFGIPWLAVLASPVFVDSPPSGRHGLATMVLARGAALVTGAALLGAFLVSSFGLDSINVIRPSDRAAVQRFQEQGGAHPPYPYYLLLLNTGDLPTSPPMRGGGHFIWGRDRLNDQVREERPFHAKAKMVLLTDRFLRFTEADAQHATLYAMWSPVGATYARTYGIQSLEQSAALRDAFRASPFWSTELQSDGTYLFRFEPTRYQSEQP